MVQKCSLKQNIQEFSDYIYKIVVILYFVHLSKMIQ